MDSQSPRFKFRLGLFIIAGISLFIIAIFIIGKQKNLFNPVFKLATTFHNISGLQVGNKIRFSGINVGTVDKIKIINDSTVEVDMIIREEIQQFIRTDCETSIGSEGIIGDRFLVISEGGKNSALIKDGEQLKSIEPVETDAILASLKVSAGNAEIITQQLAEILLKINNGNGTLGKLIQDSTIAENFGQTIVNLKNSSKSLNENMEAAKHNFLLKGYFERKEKNAAKVKEEEQKKAEEQKKKSENK